MLKMISRQLFMRNKLYPAIDTQKEQPNKIPLFKSNK